jgi:hypothetical protein
MTSAPRRRVVDTSNWAPLKASSMPESSVVDPDPHGSAFDLAVLDTDPYLNGDPDPDPGAWKWDKINKPGFLPFHKELLYLRMYVF